MTGCRASAASWAYKCLLLLFHEDSLNFKVTVEVLWVKYPEMILRRLFCLKIQKNTGPSCSNPGYVSANPGLNFNPDLFFFSSIVLCGTFFYIFFLQYPILKL